MMTKQRVSRGMPGRPSTPDGQPYPSDWEDVADLRVLRTKDDNWQQLIRWRRDMGRQGWRLLRVTAGNGELVAVFGRTKNDLLSRSEGPAGD
jgi:hypothetical protein